MLILAFDTATRVATSALVADGELLGERRSRASALLEAVDALLRQGGARVADLDAVAVGVGPGSFTGLRIGLAYARALGFACALPAAGVSTLGALAAGVPGAVPVIDARRREVFALVGGVPRVLAPDELALPPGTVCVGDGALRYRELLEERGLVVPGDEELHVPHARFHAALARDYGDAELVEPLYLREPDAKAAA